MLKAYKYRLYPTEAQSELINKHIGACRFIYNLALEVKKHAWQTQRKTLTCYDLMNQLPDLKNGCEWLKEVSSQSLQQAIINLDKAFKQFFNGHCDFPKFKQKRRGVQSFRNPHGCKVKFSNNIVTIPMFKEGIRFVQHRAAEGKIKSSTVSRTPTGKYFISILVETKNIIPQKKFIKESRSIGIDLGLNHFAITSDGQKFDNPKYLRSSISRLKVLQRRASRKIKGSNNRKKAFNKVAILHERIANQRQDFLHKLSSKIISENQTISIEDLHISGMMQNHCISKSVSDAGWGMFIEMLKYKSEWYGKNILYIPRFYPSSKTCSNCGFVNNNLTLAHREWACICGAVHDRDINAAINIKNYCLKNSPKGIREEPVELSTTVGAKKQEAIALPPIFLQS